MRERIRCWLKITAALVVGLLVYAAANLSGMREILFAYKTLLVRQFGTPAQLEAVVDEAGYRLAAERDELELYEARRAFRQAVDAQRRLAQIDAGLADYAVRIAINDRHTRDEHEDPDEQHRAEV